MPSLPTTCLVGPGQPTARLADALSMALSGGPAVAVVPDSPPGLRMSVAMALRSADEAQDQDAVLLTTSGSTGPPKGVRLGASAVRASAVGAADVLGGPSGWLLCLPTSHVAGVMVLARALVHSQPWHEVSLADGFQTQAFSAAASRALAEGPVATALVPTQLHRLLEDVVATSRLAAMRAVLLGGAAAPPALLRRARDAGVPVVRSYGMTETCGGCVYDGRPLAGVAVRQRGSRLHVRGPVLFSGYLDGSPGPGPDGWFDTGDLGAITDGQVEVYGRDGEVAVSGGVSVPLARVDVLLHGMEEVGEAASAAVPDEQWGQRIVAAVVLRPTGEDPPTAGHLLARLREEAEPAFVPRQLLVMKALPRLPSGKVDRGAVAELILGPGRSP